MGIITLEKRHGCGNDFLVVDAIELANLLHGEEWPEFARRVCNRHFGVGADGLLVVARPDMENPTDMVILNADGSRPEMCGNGIRCAAAFAMSKGWVQGFPFSVSTDAGLKEVKLHNSTRQGSEQPLLYQVGMGEPILIPKDIPTTAKIGDHGLVTANFEVGGSYVPLKARCVSMGNPHAVVLMREDTQFPIEVWGSQIETSDLFPNRTNVEFVVINKQDPHKAKVRIWERGVGETIACGTGACAIAVVGIRLGVMRSPVEVELPGGTLTVDWDQAGEVQLTGPAEKIADIRYPYEGGS